MLFGRYHSYEDFSLILIKKEIGAPAVKEKKIDIPGADGELDLTDFFGEPKYENVKLKFDFETIIPPNGFMALFSLIKNAIHGKKERIIFNGDPSFCYMGRCFVSSFKNEKNIGIISIECDCEPWRYKTNKTVINTAVNGAESVILTNGRKRAVPLVTIETESSLNIVYRDVNVWDLGAGSYTLPELELAEGDNLVTVTGTGNISFEWQEAAL